MPFETICFSCPQHAVDEGHPGGFPHFCKDNDSGPPKAMRRFPVKCASHPDPKHRPEAMSAKRLLDARAPLEEPTPPGVSDYDRGFADGRRSVFDEMRAHIKKLYGETDNAEDSKGV